MKSAREIETKKIEAEKRIERLVPGLSDGMLAEDAYNLIAEGIESRDKRIAALRGILQFECRCKFINARSCPACKALAADDKAAEL